MRTNADPEYLSRLTDFFWKEASIFRVLIVHLSVGHEKFGGRK